MDYKLGIDIGGTKIRAVIWNGKKITSAFSAKTPKIKKEFIEILKTKIKKLIGNNGEIKSVGIGVAGVIGKNKIIFSPNISYLRNFNFRDIFPRLPLKIDNDARVFLSGELKFGNGIKAKKVMGFTVGTGIGRAFAENGKVKKIKKFEYPEKWEKKYQRIRDFKTDVALAEFLGNRLALIAKKYSPEIVVIGGGILKRKNFFGLLKEKLSKKMKEKSEKIKFKKATSADSVAIGAALLV
ncbi:MAG: ROK family protein [Patescibacteria group bacterium]